MIDVSGKVKLPKLKIDTPEAKFWLSVALEEQKEIRKRTESQGQDVKGHAFKPYTPAYAKKRAKAGRSLKPNLSFTGKMLGWMQARGAKNYGKITLNGQQGLIGWAQEKRGRPWFDLSEKQRKRVVRRFTDWMTRKNRLKK